MAKKKKKVSKMTLAVLKEKRRVHARMKRANLSEEQKKVEREKARIRTAMKRAMETPEEREKRLKKGREQQRKLRAAQAALRKESQVLGMEDMAVGSRRIVLESPEQRRSRLDKLKEKRRAETDEQRERRLRREREYKREKRLASETEEQKERRLKREVNKQLSAERKLAKTLANHWNGCLSDEGKKNNPYLALLNLQPTHRPPSQKKIVSGKIEGLPDIVLETVEQEDDSYDEVSDLPLVPALQCEVIIRDEDSLIDDPEEESALTRFLKLQNTSITLTRTSSKSQPLNNYEPYNSLPHNPSRRTIKRELVSSSDSNSSQLTVNRHSIMSELLSDSYHSSAYHLGRSGIMSESVSSCESFNSSLHTLTRTSIKSELLSSCESSNSSTHYSDSRSDLNDSKHDIVEIKHEFAGIKSHLSD